MTRQCPDLPDMDDCKSKKKRCLTGPCVGEAYTEGEECPAGFVFDASTCECVSVCGTQYRLTITLYGGGWPYEDCGLGPGVRPAFSETNVLVTTSPGLVENFVNANWDPFGPGYAADGPFSYQVESDLACGGLPAGASVADYAGQSRCYVSPVPIQDYFYYTLDLVEIFVDGEWVPQP